MTTTFKKRACFRLDASPEIGAGHLMRCLTLAEALKKQKWQCTFLISQEAKSLYSALISPEHKVLDQPQCPENTDLLIVDHYGLDHRYEAESRNNADIILTIDDLADRKHDCDILLDQTYGRSKADYLSLVREKCSVLTGSQYALLRPQFKEYREQSLTSQSKDKSVSKILITLGGTNVHNINTTVLNHLKQIKDSSLKIIVILGSKAHNLKSVQAAIEELNASTQHHAVLKLDVHDMAQYMANADLAIGAGGTSSWERCCLGLPTILITLAANQNKTAQELHEAGAVMHIGSHSEVNATKLMEALKKLSRDHHARTMMSHNAANVCDGNGTMRILNKIEHARLNLLTLRPATISGAKLLLEWRNDPKTRESSKNSGVIDMDTHKEWLENTLKSEERQIYIAEIRQRALGTIRIDELAETSLLSWNIAPKERGKGWGRHMLQKILLQNPDKIFEAHIKRNNKPSIKMAEKCGFTLYKDQEDLLIYRNKNPHKAENETI